MSANRRRPKNIFIELSGDNQHHNIRLNEVLKTTSDVRIIEYGIYGAPVVGTTPVSPYIAVSFDFSGFQINETFSNVTETHDVPLLVQGENTVRTYDGRGLVLGDTTGDVKVRFEIRVQGSDGRRHNPSTNRLFDRLYLRLLVTERLRQTDPLFLLQQQPIKDIMNTV